MNVTPIRRPLDGEQVLAVDPPLEPRVDAGWRRRLNLFTGRSLDAQALTAEQRSREARTALLARAVTPGIVTGLEASLRGTDFGDAELDIAPGLGITVHGEDVRLPRSLHVKLDQLQMIEGGGAGPTLRERIDRGGPVPSAMVLVLQPVLVEEIGGADPLDPCERDPRSEAFEDQRTVDGVRPVLYAWPVDEIPLPAAGPRWRNSLAWRVFETERNLEPGEFLPWQEAGLPIGLAGLDEAASALFLDRSTVARMGGRPRPRTAVLPAAGQPSLWQARIQQFAEHLAELLADPDADIAGAAARFGLLPPAGLLPRDAATLARPGVGSPDQDGGDQVFFPARFEVGAAPIPLDELEPIFDASAPLAPIDLGQEQEEVQILVPVPGALYDPHLLVRERMDPEFNETLDKFRDDRNQWLGRREDVRNKAGALTRALGGSEAKPPFPDDEPDKQSDEISILSEPAEADFGSFEDLGPSLPIGLRIRVVIAFRDLVNAFQQGRFQTIQKEWDGSGELLTKQGLGGFIRQLEGKISQANDKIDLGFLHLQTGIYRVRQIVLGNVAGTRLATSPVLAEIAKGESARATRQDLEQVFRGSQSAVQGVQDSSDAAFSKASKAFKESPLEFQQFSVTNQIDIGSTFAAKVDLPKTGLETAVLGLSPSALSFTGTFSPTAGDIQGQTALPGVAIDFRSLSVAERLAVPPAAQALDMVRAQQLQLLLDLEALGLVVEDLTVPLLGTVGNKRQRVDQSFSQVRGKVANAVMTQPITSSPDEADLLDDAVLFQENVSLLLRRLEGRVELYRAALEACREAAKTIQGHLAAARQRLGTIDRELAEARHDVTVGLALRAEEQKRIDGINERRLEILTNHVPFLAYHRPRVAETLMPDAPVRALDPAPSEDPVPAALASPVDPPAELREMVELLRNAPVRWFPRLARLLDRLDRIDVLRDTLRFAKGRAEVALARPSLIAAASLTLAGPSAEGTRKALAAQRAKVVQYRTEMARIDLAAVERQSWKGAAEVAKKVLSLGDLLDTPHGRADVTRLGARELDEILRVASALWAGFGAVLPALRLDWVERLSQFDALVDLHRLSSLPRWEEIEILERRALQSLADWLFQRVDSREPEAVALINDLVRVCILLASHAPVDRIVAGRVAENTPVRPGVSVPLVVDVSKVRIGMHVFLFSQDKTVARGVVEDLGDGRAMARVLEAFQDTASVVKDARVEFTETTVWKALK